ncbi:MAG: MarR family winged helix-turn-helix transcriptional regulator [Solirubrobacterales bacterium]
MHATDVEAIEEATRREVGPAEKESAARLTALMHHMFLYDRGNQLRVIEETGLSMTQCKVLLELGGLGQDAQAWQVSDLAELFGVSVPSMSRAVDALVKAKLASRVEDPDDRRVRQVKITAKGKRLVATLVTVRLSGIESFVATLSAAQRRMLDAAVEALMDREDLAQTYERLRGSELA